MNNNNQYGDIIRLKQELEAQEADILSPLATVNQMARRRTEEPELQTGYRQNFSVDVDRILHSLAYTRYIDKTQVFYLIENDHITHRVLHVQLVSKVSRTIGRYLKLNEDLIEAIALGHDIGHVPFGHDGERVLSKLCQNAGIGHFLHNVQSVQFLDKVERKGKGWNLCLQTIDGVLCHDGEVHNQQLAPCRDKTFDFLEKEMQVKRISPDIDLIPMTMEGCVVRMADTISYIGRDIEDAIRLGIIDRSDLPENSVRVLGETNGTIVYRLVSDVIANSIGKPYITFSPEVSNALYQLKQFNLERIYLHHRIKKHLSIIEDLFKQMFERYLNDLVHQNQESPVFFQFLEGMSAQYLKNHTQQEIVRDFIAGMTDKYFLRQFPDHMRPKI